MEGAKKMAIVPYKVWEDMKRWKEEQIQKPRLPPNPNVSSTAHLQRDLSSVLANDELSEAEKSQLYGETLHKFKTAHQKALKETTLSLATPSAAAGSQNQLAKINQHILSSVPATMKRKAELLLSMLKDHPTMSWDEQGTVKLYGQPIPGSNIIDLVNDVLRNRKGIEPTGWQSFAEGLRELNIPQDVVGNRDRWDWIHHPPSHPSPPTKAAKSPAEDEFMTPPPQKTKSTVVRKKRTSSSSRIPLLTSKQKRIKHEALPKSLSGTKKRLQERLSLTPNRLSSTKEHIKKELFSPKQWLSFDDQ